MDAADGQSENIMPLLTLLGGKGIQTNYR